MSEKLQTAPWSPMEIETYLACQSLRQPIPRSAKKALQRKGLVRGDGEISQAGWSLIGRLRHLRKLELVDVRPEQKIEQPRPPAPRGYPGTGPRRERMVKAKIARLNQRDYERSVAKAKAQKPEVAKEPVFAENPYA